MRLLIDGYNLLHASDVFGVGDDAGTLRGSREALLGLLAERLPAKLRKATLIVFDAKDAPPGLPDRIEVGGMRVRFARGYPDADALLEELLDRAKNAKQLTVVSGDHRVQRAARSRGAKPIDADVWLRELRQPSSSPSAESPGKQNVGSKREWIKAFSDEAELAAIEQEAAKAPSPRSATRPAADPRPAPAGGEQDPPKRQAKKRRGELRRSSDAKPTFGAGVFDPFPPGYAEDLEQELRRQTDAVKPNDSQNPPAGDDAQDE